MRSLAWSGSMSYRCTVRIPVPHALSSVTRFPPLVGDRLPSSPACLMSGRAKGPVMASPGLYFFAMLGSFQSIVVVGDSTQ